MCQKICSAGDKFSHEIFSCVLEDFERTETHLYFIFLPTHLENEIFSDQSQLLSRKEQKIKGKRAVKLRTAVRGALPLRPNGARGTVRENRKTSGSGFRFIRGRMMFRTILHEV